MNGEQAALVAAVGGALAMISLVACALLWRTTRRLATRIDELERRTPHAAAAAEPPAAYVITGVPGSEAQTTTAAGEGLDSVVTGRIDGALFADIVARESLIKAAGFAHGLRRALSPDARNRVRFEMKREVKRSRKQRRADVKAALRDQHARDRATPTEEDAA